MSETLDVALAIDRYFAAWNELDPAKRLALVGEAWHPDGRYVDPVADVVGHAGISDMIGAVHDSYPGVTLRTGSALDTHHDLVRFVWEIVDGDGSVALSGIDVARLGDDGRIGDVRGFFGAALEPAVQ